jgi:cob(I)alamin adenosyltransferase
MPLSAFQGAVGERMMKSYNRADSAGDGGDGGDTCRYGGQRVRKCHPLVVANGEIDELSAHLGLCRASAAGAVSRADAQCWFATIEAILDRVQADLVALGAMLAVDAGQAPPAAVDDADVARLEAAITKTGKGLPPLKRFIVPGGCELACRLHVARCVCRRAERSLVLALDAHLAVPPPALRYLNRLGDLLFTLARLANRTADAEERHWRP